MAYVKIQNIETKEVKTIHAVDAREWVDKDVVILERDKKTDKVIKTKPIWKILGKSVNPFDTKPQDAVLEERIQALEQQKLQDQEGDDKPKDEIPSDTPLEKLTVPELKDKAEEAGIEDYADMKKADLVAALKG